MFSLPLDLYADWRRDTLAPPGLSETPPPNPPPERLLHAVWQHQRLWRDQLLTLDGRTVRILHPGFRNREAGPDFRQAVLQFADDPPLTGDVEIDLLPSHWQAHGHHQNPAYRHVLLHVVWDSAAPLASAPPTLCLKHRRDSPVAELQKWFNTGAAQVPPASQDGQCRPCLSAVTPSVLQALLHQAARVRLEAKATQIEARARQAGWEQSLWEALFRALGYKQNIWPMQRVAELLPRLAALEPSPAPKVLAWQARLYGLSGLLPAELTRARPDADDYLRRLWDLWWRDQDRCRDVLLPRRLWCFSNLRPANHPQRRLALAAHWLSQGNLPARLEKWLTTDIPTARLNLSLLEILQTPSDDFWSWHWTFRSRRRPAPQPLLGAQRVADLAANAILPWFWARAQAGQNQALQLIAEQRYFAWPKAEDNAVLRLARQRLLGGQNPRWIRAAAEQQGLLQIVRDFCDQSNAICAGCAFPEKIKQLEPAN